MKSIFGNPDFARIVARQLMSDRIDESRRRSRARNARRGRHGAPPAA
jgi:hypothetical protein